MKILSHPGHSYQKIKGKWTWLKKLEDISPLIQEAYLVPNAALMLRVRLLMDTGQPSVFISPPSVSASRHISHFPQAHHAFLNFPHLPFSTCPLDSLRLSHLTPHTHPQSVNVLYCVHLYSCSMVTVYNQLTSPFPLPVCHVSAVHVRLSPLHLFLFLIFCLMSATCVLTLSVYDPLACLAPLVLYACLDCLLVPKPVKVNTDLVKIFFFNLFCPSVLPHTGPQSCCFVHTSVT